MDSVGDFANICPVSHHPRTLPLSLSPCLSLSLAVSLFLVINTLVVVMDFICGYFKLFRCFFPFLLCCLKCTCTVQYCTDIQDRSDQSLVTGSLRNALGYGRQPSRAFVKLLRPSVSIDANPTEMGIRRGKWQQWRCVSPSLQQPGLRDLECFP